MLDLGLGSIHVLKFSKKMFLAALSGYPKQQSIDKISEIEKNERGWYSGSIGWITNKQNCQFYAAIRSALLHKQTLYIYAGAGITSDSDSDEEWKEIKNKMRTILEAIV